MLLDGDVDGGGVAAGGQAEEVGGDAREGCGGEGDGAIEGGGGGGGGGLTRLLTALYPDFTSWTTLLTVSAVPAGSFAASAGLATAVAADDRSAATAPALMFPPVASVTAIPAGFVTVVTAVDPFSKSSEGTPAAVPIIRDDPLTARPAEPIPEIAAFRAAPASIASSEAPPVTTAELNSRIPVSTWISPWETGVP